MRKLAATVRKMTVVSTALLLATALFMVPNQGTAAEPIKFGVSTAISGDAAAYGKPFLDAILMMADIINAEGGILDRKVQVVYYDDKGIPDKALEISKKLVHEDKVHTLQPGSTSGCRPKAGSLRDIPKVTRQSLSRRLRSSIALIPVTSCSSVSTRVSSVADMMVPFAFRASFVYTSDRVAPDAVVAPPIFPL